MKQRYSMAVVALVLAALGLWSASSQARGTRIWELAGFDELDKGEVIGTRVSSRGEVALGFQANKLGLSEIGLVWSAVTGKKGVVFLGTGYEGKIFRVNGNSVSEIATTGQLVVTSMALDKRGDLYVATLPDAVIWKVPKPAGIRPGKPVKAKKWATLPKGTLHVWQIGFDSVKRMLYAATGPEGKLFAIGPDGKASVYLDTEEEHVMCVAFDHKKRLVAGTSPSALVFRISGPGRAVALADFDGTEVKSLHVYDKELVAAVNQFSITPSIPSKPAKSKTGKPKDTKKPGDGEIYRLGPQGQFEQLWKQKKGHVVALEVSRSGVIYAGLGTDGKIISIDADRVVRTELDLDEREVMALIVDDQLRFALTGDSGAVYQVDWARPADAIYYTPLLDAGTVSQWGRVSWFANGPLRVQSRSGNTIKPDNTWSDWSADLRSGDEIQSPAAGYLQLRLTWANNKQGVLRSLQVAYRSFNQRTVITELNPSSPFPNPSRSSSRTDPKISTRTVSAHFINRNELELDLNWRVSNPDGDTMRYQLWYQAMGETLWRPITKPDEVHSATHYTWRTESIPEGVYRIRLRADDSPDNDPSEVLTDEFFSVPVLVDNHQPSVKGLTVTGKRVRGRAVDSFSEIAAIQYSVDAGPWLPIFSKDGVLDEKSEEFESTLPDELPAGPHAVAVRAFDRAGNMGSAEVHVQLK